MKAVVLATDGCEDVELVTCVDVLRRAKIHVDVVSCDEGDVVQCANLVNIVPDLKIEQISVLDHDMIVLPGGGKAAKHFSTNHHVQEAIKAMHKAGKWVAAICASPLALSTAGVIAHSSVTVYPGMEGGLQCRGVEKHAVVRDGKIVTGRAPGSAMAFALELVECLAGVECREQVARDLVY